MASHGFFGYDPYDDDGYYYASPYRYTYPYYSYNRPAPARSAGGFFPAADHYGYRHEPASALRTGGFFPAKLDVDSYYQPTPARRAVGFFPAARNVEPAAAVRPKSGSLSRSASIPVRFVGSEPEPEHARLPVTRLPSEDARVPVKRAPSADEAAVRLEAAARGFMARSAVRSLRAVEREVGEVAEKVSREAEALRGDARVRVAVGEALMRLLLRLDAVRGAREYRGRVARRVLALQDAVDALEQRPAAAPEEGEAETTSAVATMEEEEEENAVAPEGAVEKRGVAEDNTASETSAEMEVDGGRAASQPSAAEDTSHGGGDKPADEVAEGEWEMVTEEPVAAISAAPHAPPQLQDPAEVTRRPAEAGGAGGGVEAKKLMEMVIGALAERVDSLERAVRRVEDAERRRRAKKLRKQGKGSSQIKCYSD